MVGEIQKKISELEMKALYYYSEGEVELAIFFKNASIGLKMKLQDVEVN